MLTEIPIEISVTAVLVGLAVVLAAAVAGIFLARREVKLVNPNDVLRDP